MKRIIHWGEFENNEREPHPDIVPHSAKLDKLMKLEKCPIYSSDESDKVKEIKLKNPLITQTIEVMNQTDMLQVLIDTYASRSRANLNNYVLNPCQMIPQVDFPPENATPIPINEKFIKPFWFIPPIETKFSKGVTKSYPKIPQQISRQAIRKTICGLLRMAGFNDASNNALVLFIDAVDEFFKNFMVQIKDIQMNNGKEKSTEIDFQKLEMSYQALMQDTLISLHNYYKNDIICKNRIEIMNFKKVHQEYDKLMKESQNMQKSTFKDEDYMNFLDFTNTITPTTSGTMQSVVAQTNDVNNVNIINLLDGGGDNQNSGNFKDIFEGDVVETPAQEEQINFGSVGPPSLEQ